MKKIKISIENNIKINSFKPLCWTEIGKRAIENYKLLPYIDASCRREPDLENPYPSISALCRQGMFAPTLKKGDIVVYITVSGKYEPFNENHHRLFAILQVEKVYNSHQEAFIDYKKQGLPIPSNCMVEGNLPYEFDKTAGNFGTKRQIRHFLNYPIDKQKKIGKKLINSWDKSYLEKSKKWTSFIKTRCIYKNIENPMPIFRQDFEAIFHKVPNTRSPKKITEKQLVKLFEHIGIQIKMTTE